MRVTEQLSQALVVELKKKPVWQTHFWVLADRVKCESASQTVQTVAELHSRQPEILSPQVVHVSAWFTWKPVTQVVQFVEELQREQLLIMLPHITHTFGSRVYPSSQEHMDPSRCMLVEGSQAVQVDGDEQFTHPLINTEQRGHIPDCTVLPV